MNNYNPYLQSNGIMWCRGIEGAKAWQLLPNTNVLLLDSEVDGIFYIKSSDNIGMCTIRTFKFEEVVEEQKEESQYVTKKELEEMFQKYLKPEAKDEQPVQTTLL